MKCNFIATYLWTDAIINAALKTSGGVSYVAANLKCYLSVLHVSLCLFKKMAEWYIVHLFVE